jgi:hypothetical protein
MAPLAVAAQTPFARDIIPTLTFTDSYLELPLEVPGDPGVYDLYEKGEVSIKAELSMAGVDLATITGDTVFKLQFGYIELSLPLSSDPGYTPGKTSASLPIIGTNPDTSAPVKVGTVDLVWNAQRLTVSVAIVDFNSDFQIAAADDAYTEGAISDDTSVTLQFADRILKNRIAYYKGTGSVYALTVGRGENRERFADMAKVNISGEIDSVLPTVGITNPASGNNSTLSPSITVTGEAADREMGKVFVQVNGGAFAEAMLQANGKWSLADVALQQGPNTIVAKAVDLGGNERLSEPRSIRYVILTQLTVNAAGTGVGRVTSSFFPALSYDPAVAPPQYQGAQELGGIFTVVAKPAAGELFTGWTSNFALSPSQTASPELTFTLQEGQTITANFTANPFAVSGAIGRYTSLVQSDDPADRGFFSGVLTKTGAFTGKVRIGKLVLPIKTQFNAQGQLTAPLIISKDGQSYTVNLDLDLTEDGARALSGTISGGDITATVTGEQTQLAKKGPASTHVGSYTVLFIRNSATNDDTYPFGHGFGRAKVNKQGMVRFVGRLGDGTPVSASSYVAETGFWPFFAQLYGKRGSISGVLTFDLASPDVVVGGSVDWVKPAAFPTNSSRKASRAEAT